MRDLEPRILSHAGLTHILEVLVSSSNFRHTDYMRRKHMPIAPLETLNCFRIPHAEAELKLHQALLLLQYIVIKYQEFHYWSTSVAIKPAIAFVTYFYLV